MARSLVSRLATTVGKSLPLVVWEGALSALVWQVARMQTLPTPSKKAFDSSSSSARAHTAYMRNDEAIYTGRAVVINKPIHLSELGLTSTGGGDPEHGFRAWLDREGFASLNRMLYEAVGDATATSSAYEAQTNAFRIILHEYTHWLIFNSTSLATLYDAAAWRVRLLQLILCENINNGTAIPRVLDSESVRQLRTDLCKLSHELDARVSSDAGPGELLVDLARHQYKTDYFYQALAAIVVEPVTWALVEPGFIRDRDERLRAYFGDDDGYRLQDGMRLRDVAESILQMSLGYLRAGGSRETLLNKARASLDFPLARAPIEDFDKLVRLVLHRFSSEMKGDSADLADRMDKRFLSALIYAVAYRGSSVNHQAAVRRIIVKGGARILRREFEIFMHGVRIARTSSPQPTYRLPTVFANAEVAGELKKLRYDPLTGLTASADTHSPIGSIATRTTGKQLNRIDDLVGDLPATLGTALVLLHDLDELRRGLRRDPSEEDLAWLIEGFPRLSYTAAREGAANYTAALLQLARNGSRTDLSYESLIRGEGESIRAFFRFWLQFLAAFGESAIEMYHEHGL